MNVLHIFDEECELPYSSSLRPFALTTCSRVLENLKVGQLVTNSRFLLNPKMHRRDYRNPPALRILSHSNTVRTSLPVFRKIAFMLGCSKFCVHFFIYPMFAACPAHLVRLLLSAIHSHNSEP